MAATTPQRRSQREMTAKVENPKKKEKIAKPTTQPPTVVGTAKAAAAAAAAAVEKESKMAAAQRALITEEHLPPLSLVITVLLCSGFMLLFALRDFMSTGRNIWGNADEAMMLWTKSTDWFHDGKDGWKSQAGGFSAVQSISTDRNNMGGFFVRKMAGAAAASCGLHKLLPLLVHPSSSGGGGGAVWKLHHFTPLLYTSIVANVAVLAFYSVYWNEFRHASVWQLPCMQMIVLFLETLVMLYHVLTLSFTTRGTTKSSTLRAPAVALNVDGKTPNSPPSRIVARTVSIVSGAGVLLIAMRDLFFPGRILPFLPRDDLYLEWTNALLHSPPAGSPEALQHGMEAPLYIGDLYMSQFMALHLILLCLYKLVTAFGIKHGSDGRGQHQARMIWQASTIGNCCILFLLRLFSRAAGSASLDLRWHLMAFGYETFILGLYGFF